MITRAGWLELPLELAAELLAEGRQVVRFAVGDEDVGPGRADLYLGVTRFPPALRMSVCRLGHDMSVRPRTRSASTGVHGPWQITAAGLPAPNIDRVKSTAAGTVRSWSGLATPPSRTSVW